MNIYGQMFNTFVRSCLHTHEIRKWYNVRTFDILLSTRSSNTSRPYARHAPALILYDNVKLITWCVPLVFQNLNIFSSLSAESFSTVMKVLKHSILATDLCMYFQWVNICTHDLTNVASVRLMRLFKRLQPEGLRLCK